MVFFSSRLKKALYSLRRQSLQVCTLDDYLPNCEPLPHPIHPPPLPSSLVSPPPRPSLSWAAVLNQFFFSLCCFPILNPYLVMQKKICKNKMFHYFVNITKLGSKWLRYQPLSQKPFKSKTPSREACFICSRGECRTIFQNCYNPGNIFRTGDGELSKHLTWFDQSAISTDHIDTGPCYFKSFEVRGLCKAFALKPVDMMHISHDLLAGRNNGVSQY